MLHSILRAWGPGLRVLALLVPIMPLGPMLGIAEVWAAACERPARIVYSMVPESEPREALAAFTPILNDLRESLGIPVDTAVPSSYAAVVEGLMSGAIHVARLGPASYIAARKADPGLKAFATFSRKAGAFGGEGPFYHSLLIVRSGGRFSALRSLQGMRVALVDPDSTSGARLPRRLLPKTTGISLDRYFRRLSYAGDHAQAALAVLKQETDAAFVSSTQLSALVEAGKASAQDFRVLWRSPPIPMDPFVYRDGLCEDIKAKIRNVFYRRDGRLPDAGLKSMDATRILLLGDEAFDILRDVL